MQRIGLEIYTTAYEATKILDSVADHKVELEIPVGSILLDNILNLKIIAESAKKTGKGVDFVTNDAFGENLIKILKGESDEVVVKESEVVSVGTQVAAKVGSKIKLPTISLPGFRFKIAIPVFLCLLIGLGFLFTGRMHKAKITLYFSPQTLTKSVTVKVGDGLKTDLDKKVLSGLKISRSLEHSLTASSTGTKLEGEKASGTVYFYNKTTNEISLKKGTEVTYEDSKKVKYVFTTESDVSVPARKDTPDTITPGKSDSVKVRAEDIGESYNIKKDKELSVKGYKSSELTGVSAENFKGGSSEEIKIVTQADISKLESDLANYVSTQPTEVLKNAVATGFGFIDKSEQVISKNVVINNKVGDEKDQLSGSIVAQIEGLSYSKSELTDFMGKLSENLVPAGYEFYSYNKDIKVEVLGNTEKTALSPTEADLQVTFKFFIVPKIDTKKVFNDISGKGVQEAVKILDSINEVEKVELNIVPNLPLFDKVPLRESSVEIKTAVGE